MLNDKFFKDEKEKKNMILKIQQEGYKFIAYCECIGHNPVTTFWTDFTIAEWFGEKAIRDTYKKCRDEWKDFPEYAAELTLVLNWKIWDFYKTDEKLAELYNELWNDCDMFFTEYYDDDENKMQVYFRLTD